MDGGRPEREAAPLREGEAKYHLAQETNALVKSRNKKIIEEVAAEALGEAGIAPPTGEGMYRGNGLPSEETNNLKPSPPVRKTSAAIFPDGGGMGPLPAPKPKAEAEVSAKQLPQKESQRRMAICNQCPELLALDRCRRCGCFMRIKTQIPGAQCPLQKW